jgi:hypothetical protein
MNKTYIPKLLRISASVLFAMAVFAAAASAQEMTIVYAYGDPLIRSTGGEEFPAEIGAAVVPGDRLIIPRGSSIEIDYEGARIMINAPGEFSADSLFQGASGGGTNREVLRSLSERVERLRGGTRGRDLGAASSTGGVRADEQQGQEYEIDWVGDETVELWREGFYLMEIGDLGEAALAFGEAYDFAEAEEKAEAAYYYGYSAALIGEYAEADRVYTEYQLGPERGELYYLYLISRVDVHLHRNRPEQALADADEALADGDLSPIHRQIALYHRAVALQALGRGVDSRATLRQVAAMNADSGLRAVASAMLGD